MHIWFAVNFLLIFISVSAKQNSDCIDTNDSDQYCRQCSGRRNFINSYVDTCNCSKYYRCVKKDDKFIGISQKCQNGLKYSYRAVNCLHTPFDCFNKDPCHEKKKVIKKGYWQKKKFCGIWYSCQNFRSVRHCCPPYHNFNATLVGCEPDPSCTKHHKECKHSKTTTRPTPTYPPPIIIDDITCMDTRYQVTFQVVPDDPFSYYVLILPTWKVKKPCPQTLAFNLATCQCDIETPPRPLEPKDTCMLNITCDSLPLLDSSTTSCWVDNLGTPNVLSTNKFCQFRGPKGTGWLEIPTIMGRRLGNSLTVCWWMLWQDCKKKDKYVIFSNRGENNPTQGQKGPSILAKTIPTFQIISERKNMTRFAGHAVQVMLKTLSNHKFTATSEHLSCGFWNHVCFVYDSEIIQLYINGTRSGDPVTTDGEEIYWMNNCPLSIGQDDNMYNQRVYKGFLDEILWYTSAFSNAEILSLYNEQLHSHV